MPSVTEVAAVDEPLFDVVVRMPNSLTLEEWQRRAAEAGIDADRIAALTNALRNGPQAKIGAGVPRDRADNAKALFGKSGLQVEITPLLSLESLSSTEDSRIDCPACSRRVMLSPARQCPECGVYVDKLSDEATLRKRILEQERAKLDFQADRDARKQDQKARAALEAAIREEIRKELEAKYGVKRGLLGGPLGTVLRLGGVATLMAASFAGGRGSLAGWSWEQVTAGTAQPAAAAAQPAGTPAAAAGALPGGEADADDPVLQAAAGKRVDGKGISIEQAVAASQTLAQSVGRGGGGAATGNSAAPGGATGGGEAVLPAATKTVLALDFVRQLAEMGQLPRARGVIKSLAASPRVTGDAALTRAAQVVDTEVQAWTIAAMSDGGAVAAAQALLQRTEAIEDPVARVTALTRASVILARHPQLSAEHARAYLGRASEAAKTIEDVSLRERTLAEWAVGLGEMLFTDASARARAGTWTKWQQVNTQLGGVISHAPNHSAQARLHAIDFQLKVAAGQRPQANQSLDAALALVDKAGDLPQRARLLRAIGHFSSAGAHPKVGAASADLQAQALTKTGSERARTLLQLALLHAEAGLDGKAAELSRAALATAALPPAEAASVSAEWIARNDMANARLLQSLGMYAQAEQLVQRLGDYLL